MDIFNSEWLIKMLEKSSKEPQERMLNLFDILDDWLKAPQIDATDTQAEASPHADKRLIRFCIAQAKACKAEDPDILAEHIILIARNAAEQIAHQPNSLLHAKKVAKALIAAQTPNNSLITSSIKSFATPFNYGIAVSLVLTVISASIWWPEITKTYTAPIKVASIQPQQLNIASIQKINKKLTAHDAAKMYSKYEEMRNGTCQFPEALQIPDKDKAVYLENVVGGKLPDNLEDLATANIYLEKVRCNFTPMLMARST